MKKLIQIALLKIKLTFKERTSLLMMFVAPIVFIVVISSGFKLGGGDEDQLVTYPVGVVDLDEGIYSEKLLQLLENYPSFVLTKGDYDQVKQMVQDNKLALGLVIPKDYSASVAADTPNPIELIKLQENESTIVISGTLGNILKQLYLGKKTGEETGKVLNSMNLTTTDQSEAIQAQVETAYLSQMDSPQINYVVEKTIKEKSGEDSLSTMAIGILVLFIMFFVANGANSLFEEKEMGTWNRVKSTPSRDFSVLGGYILGNFILGWIQVGTLILFSRAVFHINWGNSPVALFVLFSCFLLAIIGLGAALSSFVKTKSQLASLTPIIIMPTSLLAGCMWPAEIMPDIMINIANFVPQRWVLIGMTDLITRSGTLSDILLPSAVLLVFAAAFFGAGLLLLNVKRKKSA